MITDATVIQILAWAAVVTGAALFGMLSFVAVRALNEQREDRTTNDKRHRENLDAQAANHQDVVNRLDVARERIEARYNELKLSQQQENQRFGQQLAGVQELIVKEIHKLNLRILRVEVWAESVGLKIKRMPTDDEDTL